MQLKRMSEYNNICDWQTDGQLQLTKRHFKPLDESLDYISN